MRLEPTLLTAFILAAVPTVAQGQECPPGGWFCEEEEGAADADATEEEADGPDVVVVEADEVVLPDESDSDDGPTVVVVKENDDDDDDKIVVIGEDTEAPPPPEPVQPYQEWGFNLHLQAALLDGDGAGDSGMGGLGFSFRYRPVPHFAFDFGLDFVGGRDWNGDRRQERGLPLTGMVFFNPYDSVQAYVLGGFHFAWADVEIARSDMIGGSPDESTEKRDYSYFGGHLGTGVEFRVGKKSALNVDLVGFIRGRTDHNADSEPEFVDPEDPSITTNTSGGGLLRGGVTFYW
jgi:hypothetical protein